MKDRNVVLILMLAGVMIAGVASGQVPFVKINFQQSGSTDPIPADYEKDFGDAYGDRGNGFFYGSSQNLTGSTRNRNNASSPDERYDSLIHLQQNNTPKTWEIAVPDNIYNIWIVCGDPDHTDQVNVLDVEGHVVLDPDGGDNWDEYTLANVEVTDGRLTIVPLATDGGTNAKVCFIEIEIADLTVNPPPVADAGPDQSVYLIDLPAQLAGSATDEGSEDGTSNGWPEGITSSFWYQLSGPGTATFTPAGGVDDLAPTVTFSEKGVYELMLQVYDIAGADANDTVTVTVKDHADEWMVGYWPLDGDALDASINSNDGTLEGAEYTGEPNGMPEYVTDAAVGTHSIDLTDYIGLEGTDNNHDPNLKHIDLGPATELDFGTTDWTISGWIKTTQVKVGNSDYGKGAIFANGADLAGGHRYCLINNEGTSGHATLVTDADTNGGKYTVQDGGTNNDGFWHFLVGMREGGEIRIYRDGVLEGTNTGPPDDYDLSGTSSWNSYIGMISDASTDPNTEIYKHHDGLIDDVRVYNYALPLDATGYDSVLSLTGMGPIVATVDAGEDFGINWKPTAPPAGPLAGVITDLGRADVGGSILWVTADGPLIDGGPTIYEATFTSPSDPLSTVSFPAPGVYTLKLQVFDPDAVDPDVPGSGYVSDTVVVTVTAPTCADVIADGLLLPYDFDGDCYVGLSDAVVILATWAQCNDPLDASCPWPF
ncbi:MAG: LamG domain-containing protein [Planctomycetes bacterium]|nr:LamG domain-containing protein [Planctomycetota bacterium]